jgi:hypothetical protein
MTKTPPPPAQGPRGRRRRTRKVSDTGFTPLNVRIPAKLMDVYDRMAEESRTGESLSDLVRKAMDYYAVAKTRYPDRVDW